MKELLSASERSRLKKMTRLEREVRERGFARIAGIDEAGRGPLAGPVVAAACVIPEGVLISGIDDSKKLLPSKRYEIFQKILALPEIDYGVGIIDSLIIDQVNILQATFQAMIAAISSLSKSPDFLLVDGNQIPSIPMPAEAIVEGDRLSQAIAAASIIAKETRDQLMKEYHFQWPEYGFDAHKGYGTKQHLLALKKYGPCPLHRFSFAPVAVSKRGFVYG